MKQKNPVFLETLYLGLGILVCLGIMLGVYALVGHFSFPVLLGGIVGSVLTVGNFFFMAIGLYNMTTGDKEGKVKARVQGGFALRLGVLFALLVVAIKFLGCDTIATLIPLLCVRPILMIRQFLFRSKTAEVSEPMTKEEENES